VSGLARVTQWVLRSPKPAAERQRRAPIISHHQDPGRASGQPRDVWRTASARRALDSGDCLLSKHGRQADAQSADYAQGDPAFSGNDRLAEYEGSLTQLGQAMLQSQAAHACWLSDVTYISTREGWLYLAAVLDVYSRAIVGWAMSQSLGGQLTTDALAMAISRRGVPDLVHSDRGSTYATSIYLDLIRKHGIRQSMSRKGNCWDTQSKIERNARPSLTRAGIGPLPLH